MRVNANDNTPPYNSSKVLMPIFPSSIGDTKLPHSASYGSLQQLLGSIWSHMFRNNLIVPVGKWRVTCLNIDLMMILIKECREDGIQFVKSQFALWRTVGSPSLRGNVAKNSCNLAQ